MNGIFDFAKALGAGAGRAPAVGERHGRACALPFVIALGLAAGLDRPISRLAMRLPRALAAFVILTLTALLALSALTLLAVQLWRDIPAALATWREPAPSGDSWRTGRAVCPRCSPTRCSGCSASSRPRAAR